MHADVFQAWIVVAARAVEEQRDHLTQLDAAIGDADHGINLARGFTAVLSALETAAPPTLEIRVEPVSVRTAPGVAGAAVSSALSTAVNPRARLMP